MPSRRVHLKFDEYLKDHGVISDYTFADKVHDRMDRDLVVWGPEHREVDFYHSEEGIRNWLRRFAHLAYQDTLTDYIRVALGHLVLDNIELRQEWLDEEDLIKRAYRSYIAKGYHRTFFRK